MKKRFIAALSVLALALALPVAAFAADSPASVSDSATSNGVTATVTTTGNVDISEGAPASNVPAGSNVLASFQVEGQNESPLNYSFNLGKQYAGAKVRVYFYNTATEEADSVELTADANGVVTFARANMEVISIVLLNADGTTTTVDAGKTATTATVKDNGSKSPATGVNTTAAAAVATVAVAGAACAAVALRKNI